MMNLIFFSAVTRGMHDACQEQVEQMARMGIQPLAFWLGLGTSLAFAPALAMEKVATQMVKNQAGV